LVNFKNSLRSLFSFGLRLIQTSWRTVAEKQIKHFVDAWIKVFWGALAFGNANWVRSRPSRKQDNSNPQNPFHGGDLVSRLPKQDTYFTKSSSFVVDIKFISTVNKFHLTFDLVFQRLGLCMLGYVTGERLL